MKIGYTKIGKRIKLSEKHGIGNGDYDSKQLLKLLSLHFPKDEFQLIGEHDLSALKSSEYNEMFPNRNVISFSNKAQKLDATICLSGPRALPDAYLPQIEILNQSGGSIIEVAHDIRFNLIRFKELTNQPKSILGQANLHLSNPETKITSRMQYAYQELLYLFEKEFQPLPGNFIETLPAKTDMLIIAMKVPENTYRETELKTFVESSDIHTHFWGTLEMGLDYKGSFSYDDLPKLCENYKYSFLVPVLPNYATSKYIEMLHNNVFPFTHADYDSQRNTILRNSSMHRIGDKSELEIKIEALNQKPHIFKILIEQYKNLISNPDFYSGKFLADIFKKELIKINE